VPQLLAVGMTPLALALLLLLLAVHMMLLVLLVLLLLLPEQLLLSAAAVLLHVLGCWVLLTRAYTRWQLAAGLALSSMSAAQLAAGG
jgi:hypothetical protein